MRFRDFIKENIFFILLELIAIINSALLLYLYNVSTQLILFVSIIIIFTLSIRYTYNFISRNKFYKTVFQTLANLDEKHLVSEVIYVRFTEAKLLLEIVKRISESMNNKITHYKKQLKDYREYIEVWIHEIKTPIAASQLILENSKMQAPHLVNDLSEEISKTEYYIDQALYYSKIDEIEQDYIIKQASLKTIVERAIRTRGKELITNKIAIQLSIPNTITVFTDSKWLAHILDQIMINSIKYRCSENPKIKIYTEKRDQSIKLYLEDNGIGIEPQDLSRVFRKGFTGENGRKYTKSTGMGLYICHKLCSKMGLKLEIDSKDGTTLSIIFPKDRMLLLQEQ